MDEIDQLKKQLQTAKSAAGSYRVDRNMWKERWEDLEIKLAIFCHLMEEALHDVREYLRVGDKDGAMRRIEKALEEIVDGSNGC